LGTGFPGCATQATLFNWRFFGDIETGLLMLHEKKHIGLKNHAWKRELAAMGTDKIHF